MMAPNCQHLSEGCICFALLGCVRVHVCAHAWINAHVLLLAVLSYVLS